MDQRWPVVKPFLLRSDEAVSSEIGRSSENRPAEKKIAACLIAYTRTRFLRR
jgi:hypothetical protein